MKQQQRQQEEKKRFQECSWLVKLWRLRWYLLVPYWAIRFRRSPWLNEDGTVESYNTWGEAWSIAVGTAQGPMRWYYTSEEVKARLDLYLSKDL